MCTSGSGSARGFRDTTGPKFLTKTEERCRTSRWRHDSTTDQDHTAGGTGVTTQTNTHTHAHTKYINTQVQVHTSTDRCILTHTHTAECYIYLCLCNRYGVCSWKRISYRCYWIMFNRDTNMTPSLWKTHTGELNLCI